MDIQALGVEEVMRNLDGFEISPVWFEFIL